MAFHLSFLFWCFLTCSSSPSFTFSPFLVCSLSLSLLLPFLSPHIFSLTLSDLFLSLTSFLACSLPYHLFSLSLIFSPAFFLSALSPVITLTHFLPCSLSFSHLLSLSPITCSLLVIFSPALSLFLIFSPAFSLSLSLSYHLFNVIHFLPCSLSPTLTLPPSFPHLLSFFSSFILPYSLFLIATNFLSPFLFSSFALLLSHQIFHFTSSINFYH